MFVADAHCDTLYNIAVNGAAPEECMITAARLGEGGVGLQTFAMFAGSRGMAGQPYEKGAAMLAAKEKLGVPLCLDALPDEPPRTPHGVLSIEGGEMLEGSLERLHEFDAAGRIRMIALTWNNENEIGHSAKSGSTEGLKPFGFELLREMDRLGVLADASHLNEAGFWDIVERAALPPIASHSNLKKLCGHSRNLTDEQVKAIIRRGGFIGINFYSNFLREDGKATLDDVLRHIDGIAELGGIDVLGFGSDFDGIESWPDGLGSPADFPALLALLEKHGYTKEELEKIAGLNLWNVLKRAEKARKE
ncbi:MAG: dipeptidase [Clostridia bacterium]|nr:dipeptidase [Clostridia bacterium]